MASGRIILIGISTTALVAMAAGSAVHRRAATIDQMPDPIIGVAALEDAGTELRRPVYPYSVIAGGVYSADEFATARDRDAVIAAAYPSIDADDLYAETVDADSFAYMSYRKDDRVYWTRHKIALRRGETILTDGEARIRARCGNGISDEPMTPTADAEPDPLAFDTTAQPLAQPGRPLFPGLAPLAGIEGAPLPNAAGFPGLAVASPLPISSGSAAFPGPVGAPQEPPVPGVTDASDVILPGLRPPGLPASLGDGSSGASGSQDSPLPGPDIHDVTSPTEPPFAPDTPPGIPGGGLDGNQGDLQPPATPTSGFGNESPNNVVTPEPSTLLLVGGPIIAGLLKRRRSTSRR